MCTFKIPPAERTRVLEQFAVATRDNVHGKHPLLVHFVTHTSFMLDLPLALRNLQSAADQYCGQMALAVAAREQVFYSFKQLESII